MIIHSPRVILRPISVDDTDEFYTWGCQSDVTQFSLSAYRYPQSKTDVEQWLASINQDKRTISFGIVEPHNQTLIGFAGIASMSTLNRSGEYFILIGNKEYWGQGLGTEVTKLVARYAFNDIGLHRLSLTAFATNPAAIKAYEKAGFQHEGVLRQSGFRNGTFHDKVMMSLLATEQPAE